LNRSRPHTQPGGVGLLGTPIRPRAVETWTTATTAGSGERSAGGYLLRFGAQACQGDGDLGCIAILWRGDEAARHSAMPEISRFKAVFSALADVGVKAEPVVYEDDVLDAVRAQLAALDGVLVWVNPIHEGRNRANLDALLREVAAHGVWVSAHPDVILKMGTKDVLYHSRTMSWGCDTALYPAYLRGTPASVD
jgi:hypothetical protein